MNAQERADVRAAQRKDAQDRRTGPSDRRRRIPTRMNTAARWWLLLWVLLAMFAFATAVDPDSRNLALVLVTFGAFTTCTLERTER